MKIWHGYGSEHSMNLVMIGRFKDASEAQKAKEAIDDITEKVSEEVQAKRLEVGELPDRFTESILATLRDLNLYIIGLNELEQFAYEFKVKHSGDQVVITTEESEVSAFMKILIDRGARVEVYSAHHHPGTGYGRGDRQSSSE